MTASSPKKYLGALTGLRGLAALFILANHACSWTAPNVAPPVNPKLVAVMTSLSMSVFFVLSGFVIHYNYAAKFQGAFLPAARRFLLARFIRLYPLYALCLILALGLSADIWPPNGLGAFIKAAAAYFAGVQSWFYFTLGGYRLLDFLFPLSWAISVELFLYLLYPLVTRLVSLAARPLFALSAVLVSFGVCMAVMYLYQIFNPYWLFEATKRFPEAAAVNPNFLHHFHQWAVYLAPYPRIPEFLQGALAAQLLLSVKDRPTSPGERLAGGLALGAGAVYLILCVQVCLISDDFALHMLRQNTLFAPGLATLMFCLSRYDQGRIARLMTVKPLVFLGEISLALYLVQTWSLRFFSTQSAEPVTGALAISWLGRYGLNVAASLVTAYVAWKWIELPANAALKRLFGLGKTKPAAGS